MKNLSAIIFFLVIALNINAQTTPPTIQWQKSLGGSLNDWAQSIQQTNDGGYIVAGYSLSNNGDITLHHGSTDTADFWIAKLDSSGNIQWQKSLGGTGDDEAYSIRQTNDGGFIAAGFTTSNNGDVTVNKGGMDVWVVKLDTSGNIQWQKSLGGSGDDKANSIQQTNDGGYIVAGSSLSNDSDVSGHHGPSGISGYPDFWIVKLDTVGNIKWQKSLGGTYDDWAQSIQQTNDGGYIVAGATQSNDGDVTGYHGSPGYPNGDYWVVKLDTSGNIQWKKSLGGTAEDCAYSIQQTNDGGYIVAGESRSNNGDVTGNHGLLDYWVVKLDTSGNITWQKSFGGSYFDKAYSIQQTNDGGYIVAGLAESVNGDVTGHHYLQGLDDYWIVKLDTSGNLQWENCFGGGSADDAESIQQTSDGGYIVAGFTNCNDGDVLFNHGGCDYWIVKLFPAPLGIKETSLTSSFSIFPNPANSKFTAIFPDDTKFIQISNSLGQVIEKRSVKNQTESVFQISGKGIYFVQIVTDKETTTKKLIIEN